MGKQKDRRDRWRGALVEAAPIRKRIVPEAVIHRRTFFEVPRTKKQISRGLVPYTVYDTALTQFAYGNFARRKPRNEGQLGDLFGDIMGAVVGKENWDARPDWMKKVKLKIPPGKVAEKVVKTFPDAAEKVIRVINQAGGEMYYRTPAGDMLIDEQTAQSGYSNYPAFLKTKDIFGSVPIWVYALGAGGILLAIMMRK